MLLRVSTRCRVPLMALLLALASAAARAQAEPPLPMQVAPVEAEVQKLLKDPDLNGVQHIRQRRFKRDDTPEPKPDTTTISTLAALFEWLSDAGRMLVWLAGIVVVALAAVWLPRWWRLRSDGGLRTLAPPPTHVQALDIRPDSLPEDIGAAAAALWQRGERAAALSLLYRGALSRLVHGHDVPIGSASTEGECLALARPRLTASAGDYLARLIGTWQRAVYAAQQPADEEALALCAAFSQHLPAAAA